MVIMVLVNRPMILDGERDVFCWVRIIVVVVFWGGEGRGGSAVGVGERGGGSVP